jgi:nitroreductase
MNFIDIAKQRYSVRKYTDQKVEKEKLNLILEAARIAPTGANKQPVHLIVAQSPEALEKVNKAARVYGAPCVIIVCSDIDKAWVRPYDGKNIADIDAAILTDHMMLQATELGLGSLWICWFKADVIKAEFGLPDNLVPVNLLALGYADGEPASPDRHDQTRNPIESLVSYDKL